MSDLNAYVSKLRDLIQEDVDYWIDEDGELEISSEVKGTFFTAHITTLPGCCGTAVLNEVDIMESFKSGEKRKLIDLIVRALAAIDGYTILMYTHVAKSERKFVLNNGWTILFDFKNARTGNTVFTAIVPLHSKAKLCFPEK